MKIFLLFSTLSAACFIASCDSTEGQKPAKSPENESVSTPPKSQVKSLFIDVHHLGAGKVNYEAVAAAHDKDLSVQQKYDVSFLKYWVDEAKGDVYCLSSSSDSGSIRKTHGEAHGLLPSKIFPVLEGTEAEANSKDSYFLDVHELGPGKVSMQDVAGAHQKDLDVQGKHGVNFINYWFNEKEGSVICLSQAPDSTAVIKTHTEAHGLVPVSVTKVLQGQ